MHPKNIYDHTKLLTFSLILICISLLTSCASSTQQRAQIEDRQISLDQSGLSTNTELDDSQVRVFDERSFQIERAEYFLQLSRSASTQNQSLDSLLSAAEHFVQAGETRRAAQSVEQLRGMQLNPTQRNRYEIVLAYNEFARSDFQAVANRLNFLLNHPSSQGSNARQQRIDALLLISLCYQSLSNYDGAITALIEREGLLLGPTQAETSRYIWQVIESLSVEQRQNVMQVTQSPRVRSRLEQSLAGQIGTAKQLPQRFELWSEPSQTLAKTIIEPQWSSTTPKAIAVLLPISSKFNKAAQALMDGIQYQHTLNTSIYKPRVDIYDIGDNPYQVNQYYAAARSNGAQVIIGPLGKDYANILSSSARKVRSVPTILLGGDKQLERQFSRLTLSPEQDGEFVAQRAIDNGYINAALLVSDNIKSTRMASAFRNYWLENGGKISKSITLPTKQYDHTTELKQLFDLNQSEYRHRLLSQTLGFKPKFSASSRKDIDFVFMIANNKVGRIIRPQISFFSGTSMPVLATSSIYNGIQNEIENADLDRTSFPVMPWVLQSNEIAPYAGQLNMLFAMGADAYLLSARLTEMQTNTSLVLDGKTGQLNIEQTGEINYSPVWAQFKSGVAVPDIALESLENTQSELNYFHKNSQDGQNEKNSYDQSNWDGRQSRRKTRTQVSKEKRP